MWLEVKVQGRGFREARFLSKTCKVTTQKTFKKFPSQQKDQTWITVQLNSARMSLITIFLNLSGTTDVASDGVKVLRCVYAQAQPFQETLCKHSSSRSDSVQTTQVPENSPNFFLSINDTFTVRLTQFCAMMSPNATPAWWLQATVQNPCGPRKSLRCNPSHIRPLNSWIYRLLWMWIQRSAGGLSNFFPTVFRETLPWANQPPAR